MPLPLILGGAAAIAGAVGIGSAVHGGVKMKEANDTMKWAESKHRESITGFETQNKKTTADMDRLGKKELEILDSFQKFSNIFEQIHNRPEFKPYEKENMKQVMAEQTSHPVLFEQIIRAMGADGYDTFVEVGPGKTLSGFAARINDQAQTFHISDFESFTQTVEALKSMGYGG